MNQAREGGWGSERQRREKASPGIKQRHEHHMRPQCWGTARSGPQLGHMDAQLGRMDAP